MKAVATDFRLDNKEGWSIANLPVITKDGKAISPEQFGEWYEKYYPVVYKHAAYLTGSMNAADDIAQEVFIRLLGTPPTHSNVPAWLVKVATNLAYNYLRNEKRKRGHGPVEDCEAANVVLIEDLAIKNAEIRLTKKVLALLSYRDRMCLLLKFSGYKYREIAATLALEKASVGKILARAQEKFKALYLKEVRER
ncbi:MAG: RNA polymerase sigma factor SigX [Bacillota bacterium]|jgi:RNA polymerase sigma factor (sigma-70 family)